AARFRDWVTRLGEGTAAGEFQASEVVARARALSAVDSPSPSVLEIYASEAKGHLATLQAEFDRWRQSPGSEASHEFMRAAHTLASSSGTAGFESIAGLAAALEQWIPFSRSTTLESDVAAIGNVIAE